MKLFMKRIFTVLPVFALVLSVSACREEPLEDNGPSTFAKKSNMVMLTVGGSATETKAGQAGTITDMIPVTDANDANTMFLEETQTDMDALIFGAPATKGIPIYTQNFGTQYPDFGAMAYSCTGTGTPTEYTSGKSMKFGQLKTSPLIYAYDFGNGTWPTGKDMVFLLSAPDQFGTTKAGGVKTITPGFTTQTIKNDGGRSANNGTITFTYTTPATYDLQKDLLFTSKTMSQEAYEENSNTRSSVLFYHALSGVKFKAGNASDKGVTIIHKVEIRNIMNSGTCVVTPLYDADGFVCEGNSNTVDPKHKSADACIWDSTKQSGKATYTIQEAETGKGIAVNTYNSNDFPASFNGGTKKYGEDNLMDAAFANTFFLMPQLTGNDCEIYINYTIKTDAGNFDGEATIPFKNRIWLPGVIYTYTLTTKQLDVYIKDYMGEEGSTHDTKSQIATYNTGNVDGYIRMAIVGNWFDNHSDGELTGKVIVNKMWDAETQIEEKSVDFDATHWVKSEIDGYDGYYYYIYPVKAGAHVSYPIFGSYKTPTDPKDGLSHLEMDLAVQIVDAANVPSGWKPTDITFSTTVDDGTLK